TDREVTDLLLGPGAAQQQVNQICRKLESRGHLVRKQRPDGRIGNYPAAASATGPERQPVAEPTPSNETLRWSTERPFERSAIVQSVPHSAGVYQILQSAEYPRYLGTTRVL